MNTHQSGSDNRYMEINNIEFIASFPHTSRSHNTTTVKVLLKHYQVEKNTVTKLTHYDTIYMLKM